MPPLMMHRGGAISRLRTIYGKTVYTLCPGPYGFIWYKLRCKGIEFLIGIATPWYCETFDVNEALPVILIEEI